MMRLWTESYAKPAPVITSATLSFVVHAVIIAAWVGVTLPAAIAACRRARESSRLHSAA